METAAAGRRRYDGEPKQLSSRAFYSLFRKAPCAEAVGRGSRFNYENIILSLVLAGDSLVRSVRECCE